MSLGPYTQADIVEAYRSVGVTVKRVIYVTSDFGRLMAYERPGKSSALGAHLEVLRDLVGPEGTVVVPTASLNLCNRGIPFDVDNTPSFRVGTFSEHVRRQAGSARSFHPFVSYTALGRDAHALTDDVARHAFGPETPEARMIDADALCVVVGKHPRLTCSTVHHVEMIMGVPYRYTKEYEHPVVRNGKTRKEMFYQYVWYRDIDLERDGNRRIFAGFSAAHDLRQAPLGRGLIHAYSMRAFAAFCQKLLARDIYAWCARPPEKRPYRV